VFEYRHWRERLLALETELNEFSGAGVFSYWRDRRNPRQRAAFWLTAFGVVVALLALIFTFWSAIEAELTRQQSVIANSAGKANETSTSANSNLPASVTSAPVYVHYPFLFSFPTISVVSQINATFLEYLSKYLQIADLQQYTELS
jgi:hypothetical protein